MNCEGSSDENSFASSTSFQEQGKEVASGDPRDCICVLIFCGEVIEDGTKDKIVVLIVMFRD
jgi:hypothetical protein